MLQNVTLLSCVTRQNELEARDYYSFLAFTLSLYWHVKEAKKSQTRTVSNSSIPNPQLYGRRESSIHSCQPTAVASTLKLAMPRSTMNDGPNKRLLLLCCCWKMWCNFHHHILHVNQTTLNTLQTFPRRL